MDENDRYHLQTGKPMFRFDGEPHLEDDPELWEELWAKCRDELLEDWIAGNSPHPGGRPPAWYRFDAVAYPARLEDESEVEWLHRLGLMQPGELEGIRREVLSLVEHNRCRSPVWGKSGHSETNFIPPGGLERFAAAHGLITEADAAILGLSPSPERTNDHGIKTRPPATSPRQRLDRLAGGPREADTVASSDINDRFD